MAELAAWYQRKISTYDKQEWETTVERRQAPLKSTKLKSDLQNLIREKKRSDLIDVDLIRGSSFPKAKPIQRPGTIVRLAIARILFFPLWQRWWTAHTSKAATRIFLILWILQLANILLYFSAPVSANLDSSCILVPLSLMIGLGFVHAYIVSTHPHHNGLSSSTQTDRSNNGVELTRQKWSEDLGVPTVSLSPPTHQTVKFDLDSVASAKHKETSDESVSPLLRNRKKNIRISRTNENREGNDGNETDIENDDKNEPEERKKHIKFGSAKMKKLRMNYLSDHSNKSRSDGGSSTNLSGDHGHCESDDLFRVNWYTNPRGEERVQHLMPSSDDECDDTASASLGAQSQNTDFPPVSNSKSCNYCSEIESESEGLEGDSAWEPFSILNPTSERISCTIWESNRVQKIQMTVVDISHIIAKRTEQHLSQKGGSLWPNALVAAFLAALLPTARLLQLLVEIEQVTPWNLVTVFLSNSPVRLLCSAFGASNWEQITNFISSLLRLGLGTLVFFLLSVAQRAFHQRFFYAKLFSHLTSARRARQSALPHFRLNRVRNIKAWLSVRSYLMKRGPQRSVEIIVSAAFVLLILLISFLVIDLLQENQRDQSKTVETLGWTAALGIVLLKLVALGTRASRKHRCLPVLLTEQINLHLAMERRPASKERLSVANNVLKLAADLLKELDPPFKISGLSTNPYLYTITKVVLLSALSGVLSDLLGFKLKLHKIKIK